MKRRDLLKGIAATLAGLVPFGLRARSRGHVRIEIVTGDADVVRVWIDDQEIACNTFEISVELRPLLEHDNTIYRSKAAAVEAQETLLGYPVIYDKISLDDARIFDETVRPALAKCFREMRHQDAEREFIFGTG